MAGAVAACAAVIGPCGLEGRGQPVSPVFVDDSPLAFDGLIRAGELAAVGNLDEAVRVLQGLLDAEGERVLAMQGEPDLFTTVRGRVHAALVGNAGLLERYRALIEPSAKEQLERNEIGSLERSRLLTPSGFEAALRLAQRQIEAAHFHAAVRTLSQLDAHPDRARENARAAADLLTLAMSYIGPEEVGGGDSDRRSRWRREAGLEERPGGRASGPEIPETRTAFTAATETDLRELLPRPLWSDAMGDRLPLDSTINLRTANPAPSPGALWLNAVATAMGDTVYANDTQTVTAWNRFTLSQKWRVRTEPIQGRRFPVGPSQNFEELAGVAADGTHVVALMGLAIQNTETPRRMLLCIDPRSGEVLWNRLLEDYKLPELEGCRFRGPVLLEQGVAVLMIEKDVTRRRLEGAYAMGIDARSGEARWLRALGSSGSLAYGYRPVVIDAPIADRGVVYAVNRLGFIASIEAWNGRVRWIRRWAGLPMTQGHADQPWESNTPVLAAGSLFVVSPDRQDVIRIDPETGIVTSRCPASKFENPDYLLAPPGSGLLVGVTATSLVSADLAAFGPDSATRRFARFQSGQVRGRVLSFGGNILVPVIDGFVVHDPRIDTEPVFRLTLDKPGNLLPLDGQLLAFDDHEVHTYLVWESAERMLKERMDADPTDPTPAITYAELSYRAGRPDGIIPAVDRALAAVEREAPGTNVAEDQGRLFRAIFSMVEPPPNVAGRALLPIEMRGALLQRLDRCAGAPAERVAYLLAAGRFHEAVDQPGQAVEAYQTVLDSPGLSLTTFTQGETVVSADFEATRRLRRLVQTHGLNLYGAFQADADRALAGLTQSLEPEPFEALARRYPVSRAAVTAWLEASTRYTTQGKSRLAVQALEEGLAVATQALGHDDPLLAELTGRLVRHLARSGLVHPALTTLEAFTRAHPGRRLTENGETINEQEITAGLRDEIARLNRRPRIGPEPAPETSAMLGWSVLEPVANETPELVADRVMMIAEDDEIALFKAEGPGAPVKAWGGVHGEDYLWMDTDGVAFSREVGEPNREDYAIVRRDLDTGRVKWESPPFRTLFAKSAIDDLLGDPQKEFIPVIDTPLQSRVPVIDLSLLFDRRTMVLLDRMGRAAAFDLESGRLLWANATTANRMHDAALEAGTLLIGGGDGPIDFEKPIADAHAADPMTGVVLALDARTGQPLHRWETPDRVRWVRLAPEGFSVVGLNDAVVSLDAYRGRVRWRAAARPLAASLAAWTLGSRVIVRSDSNDLFQIDTGDGSVREQPLDTRDRLAGGFGTIRLRPLGERAALTTQLGLAVFNAQGGLVGLDTNERDASAYFADFGERYAVTLTPSDRDPVDNRAILHLNVFTIDSLKIVARVELPVGTQSEPGPCRLLDGRLLVTSGSVTTVVELPVGE